MQEKILTVGFRYMVWALRKRIISKMRSCLADFKHPWFDEKGNLHIKMYDTYDFNEGENGLVKAGRYHMKKGNLKPFFTIHDIIVPKSVLDSIW